MQNAFQQLLSFLQQGISAIFRFVQMLWTWSVDQISHLVAVPWQQWPFWKQILLLVVIGGVIWALYKAAKEIFEAGEKILGAFASLLGVLVKTLPSVVLAGFIALTGLWVMNHLDNTPLRLPAFAWNPFSSGSTPDSGTPVNR
jgi:hypothetical protein